MHFEMYSGFIHRKKTRQLCMPFCRCMWDCTWDASGKKKIFKGTDVICTEIVSSTEIKSSVVKRLKDLEKIRKEKTKKQNKTKPV